MNSKKNELIAAYGLLQLPLFSNVLETRERVASAYFQLLGDIDGIKSQLWLSDNRNYSYMPIFIENEKREAAYEALRKENIFSRRYFHPIITRFKAYLGYNDDGSAEIADDTSRQVLCLPMSELLTDGMSVKSLILFAKSFKNKHDYNSYKKCA